jgi:hypothetical protein
MSDLENTIIFHDVNKINSLETNYNAQLKIKVWSSSLCSFHHPPFTSATPNHNSLDRIPSETLNISLRFMFSTAVKMSSEMFLTALNHHFQPSSSSNHTSRRYCLACLCSDVGNGCAALCIKFRDLFHIPLIDVAERASYSLVWSHWCHALPTGCAQSTVIINKRRMAIWVQRYEILVFCPCSVIYGALNVKLNSVLTCK